MNNVDQPAFPQREISEQTGRELAPIPGLTKREYFAAKAMQGYASRVGPGNGQDGANYLARQSIMAADALLEGLSKEKQ